MNQRKFLLDTHIIIWAVGRTDRLTLVHREILEREDECVASIASLWEITIKKSLGKLDVRDDLADLLQKTGVAIMPIKTEHLTAVRTLPHHHRDPFDRMLIAQAMTENLTMLTVDRHFALYGIALA